MRLKPKTVIDQMSAEKSDDVLASLDAKQGSCSESEWQCYKCLDGKCEDCIEWPCNCPCHINP